MTRPLSHLRPYMASLQTLMHPHLEGSDLNLLEGSGLTNPSGFEGPRPVWSVWVEPKTLRPDSTHQEKTPYL